MTNWKIEYRKTGDNYRRKVDVIANMLGIYEAPTEEEKELEIKHEEPEAPAISLPAIPEPEPETSELDTNTDTDKLTPLPDK